MRSERAHALGAGLPTSPIWRPQVSLKRSRTHSGDLRSAPVRGRETRAQHTDPRTALSFFRTAAQVRRGKPCPVPNSIHSQRNRHPIRRNSILRNTRVGKRNPRARPPQVSRYPFRSYRTRRSRLFLDDLDWRPQHPDPLQTARKESTSIQSIPSMNYSPASSTTNGQRASGSASPGRPYLRRRLPPLEVWKQAPLRPPKERETASWQCSFGGFFARTRAALTRTLPCFLPAFVGQGFPKRKEQVASPQPVLPKQIARTMEMVLAFSRHSIASPHSGVAGSLAAIRT
jgi:hypothetical protein